MNNLGKHYNHDPRHFRFPRSMDHSTGTLHRPQRDRSADVMVFVAAVACFVIAIIWGV